MIRLVPPPPPANCRPAPRAPDHIEAVSRYHHYREERALRETFYVSLEEALAGVRGCARPRQRLYGGTLDTVIHEWENRWWTARSIELSFFAISELLTRLGRGISCRRPGAPPPEYLLAWLIGARVHRRIQQTYRRAYPRSEVSLDNRVSRSLVARSERLSQLAYRDPASIYGALNFALAGQRCDIVDLTRGQIWEIKPAALASEATLQLWAYLDNYEVARVFEQCTRRGALPPLHAGSPPTLDRRVTEEFTISFLKGLIQLVVQPFTVSRLPGLILYTLRPKLSRRRAQRAQAQAMVAEGRVQLQQLLRAAGRSAQEQMDAEIAYWENAQYIATGVLITCIAVELALAPYAIPAVGAGGAAAGTEVAAGQVINLAARRGAMELARQALPEVTKKAAALVLIGAGGELLSMPPEATGLSIDLGLQLGINSSGQSL